MTVRSLNKKWIALAALLASAAALAPSGAAWAYVPPSDYIVRMLAKKRAPFRTARVRSVVTEIKDGKPTLVHFKTTTVYDFKTHLLRVWASDELGKQLFSVERILGKAPAEGEEVPPSAQESDEVLFESNPAVLAESLRAWGVPIRLPEELRAMKSDEERHASETESLGRRVSPLGLRQIAWVIGAEPSPGKQSDSARFWVEKDTFLPMRLVRGDVTIDYLNVRYNHELPFPQTVAATVKGVTLLNDDVTEVSVDGKYKELKGAYAPTSPDALSSADGALRDLVQNYFKYVR